MATRSLRVANRDAWAHFVASGEIPSFESRTKYGARPVVVDGIRFDSTKESRRYGDLVLLAKVGAIRDLVLQPSFPLLVVELWRPGPSNVVSVGRFTADFQYVDGETGETVVEDVKSTFTKTTAYRLRKRLVEAIHGIRIREV